MSSRKASTPDLDTISRVVLPFTYPDDYIRIKFVLTKEMVDYHSDYHNDIQSTLTIEDIQDAYNQIVNWDKEPKCECGGDKCHTTHSNWCPKYEQK